MDLETTKIDLEKERATRFKNSEDWQWAKEKLEKYMSVITSIETFDLTKSATTLQKDILAAKKAVGIVNSWIQEIEGDSEQRDINKPKIINNESLVTRFGDDNEN